jgi:predicted lipid carrier protein YhbT
MADAGLPAGGHMNLDELFSKVTKKAEGLTLESFVPNASILVNILGDAPRRWLVVFKDSKASISDCKDEPADGVDATVTAQDKTIISIAERTLNPTMAFFTGRLKVKGDAALVRQLSQIWPD